MIDCVVLKSVGNSGLSCFAALVECSAKPLSREKSQGLMSTLPFLSLHLRRFDSWLWLCGLYTSCKQRVRDVTEDLRQISHPITDHLPFQTYRKAHTSTKIITSDILQTPCAEHLGFLHANVRHKIQRIRGLFE